MSDDPSTTAAARAVRHLPMSLPYTRLFGAHFVVDDDTCANRSARRRQPVSTSA